MARRVGDDEAAAVGGKKAVGHINGDALLAFGLQAIHQQREINPFALSAITLRFRFQRPQLIVENLLGLIQHPPDQAGFAVVHAAAGDEAQQRFGRLGGEVVFNIGHGLAVGIHQK